MAKSNGIPVKYDPKLPPAQQRYEVILSHILGPENSPIPEEFRERFNRIKSAALMLDDLHPANVLPRLTAKYDITRKTAREDVKPAQELFKSKHHFDFDFWQQWQMKVLVDTIISCKAEGKDKERVAAHKVLKEIIGQKPESAEDPKRMGKNIFNIQLNGNQTAVSIPMEKLKGPVPEEIRTVVASLTTPDMEDADEAGIQLLVEWNKIVTLQLQLVQAKIAGDETAAAPGPHNVHTAALLNHYRLIKRLILYERIPFAVQFPYTCPVQGKNCTF